MSLFNKIHRMIDLVVPVAWTVVTSLLLLVLLFSRTRGLVSVLPDISETIILLGDMVGVRDNAAECAKCGVAMQMVDNNMLTSMNPYYGLRSSLAFTDEVVSPELNSIICAKNPCRPGCQSLVDEYSLRVNSEALSVLNRSFEDALIIGISISSLISEGTKPVAAAINRDSQWMDYLFTMMTPEERQLAPPEDYLDEDDVSGPPLSKTTPHRHVFNFRGRCISCGHVLEENECTDKEAEKGMSIYLQSREHNAPKKLCASCGVLQDHDHAGVLRDPGSTAPDKIERGSMWYLKYPLNSAHKDFCHLQCEGAFAKNVQTRIALFRFLSSYNVKERVRELRDMPLLFYLLIVSLFLVATSFPRIVTHGNLEWRETLYGVPRMPTDVHPAAANGRAARTSASAASNNRSRRR